MPAWAELLAAELAASHPALIPLTDAAKIVHRDAQALQSAAKRGELVILRGTGGKGKALVPRTELVRWLTTWAKVGGPL